MFTMAISEAFIAICNVCKDFELSVSYLLGGFYPKRKRIVRVLNCTLYTATVLPSQCLRSDYYNISSFNTSLRRHTATTGTVIEPEIYGFSKMNRYKREQITPLFNTTTVRGHTVHKERKTLCKLPNIWTLHSAHNESDPTTKKRVEYNKKCRNSNKDLLHKSPAHRVSLSLDGQSYF